MSSTFRDLCPDILLDIFCYFSIDQLFYSFYPDVLPILQTLLYESRMKFQLCLSNDDHFTATLLSLINENQVGSLRMTAAKNDFVKFRELQWITVINIHIDRMLLQKLSKLPRLTHVICIDSQFRQECFRYVCCLPFLKYFEVNLHGGYLDIPITSYQRTCPIEELVLHTPCSWEYLRRLISHLTHLRILRVMVNVDRSSDITIQHYSENFPSIEIFDLTWYSIEMENILALVRHMPHLKQLRLSGKIDVNNLNSDLWQQLLEVVCRNLKRLNVNMLISIREGADRIQKDFDNNLFFQRIQFRLIPSNDENELLILNGDFRR
ncbi:unnamed protein product [Rotaria sp. Silwood2]|nr:unnamed protein product [Rotaria sp. Silwood2]CAF2878261.1 unnamed protein product [Rotaria sp. Silwood2]CAF3180620.1 unnamed protein product [Rotaria sp. Silwood2]CAF3284116.1 unnamed protein product [Rotaria sp. Silwood2]CAF3948733.1 unnamed protein product [Rotaria sp. Silwood2]